MDKRKLDKHRLVLLFGGCNDYTDIAKDNSLAALLYYILTSEERYFITLWEHFINRKGLA